MKNGYPLWPLVLASISAIVPWACFPILIALGPPTKWAERYHLPSVEFYYRAGSIVWGTGLFFALVITPIIVLIVTFSAWLLRRKAEASG
jgi:hypothetical protein